MKPYKPLSMLRMLVGSAAIFLSGHIFASTYYISSISGDDGRTATQAKSSSTPWKSITKLNSYFSSLQPGDTVLFERGGIYSGTITPTKSGSSSASISFGAYGSGNKPLLTRLTTVGGWTSVGNGIWESSAISTAVTNMNMVTVDGYVQGMGRFPNANASNKGYLTISSHSGTNSITSSQLPTSPTWAGAEVVIRQCHWRLDRSKIKSQSGTTLSISGVSTPADGYGFFIQNNIKTLDQFGEWYYNPGTKKLSMFFGSDAPSNHLVRASSSHMNVNVFNFDYFNFDNLEFEGANETGLYLYSAAHVNVRSCDFSSMGKNGVCAGNCVNLLIDGCTFSDVLNNGIEGPGGNSYVTVRNCQFSNIAMLAGMGQTGDHTYEGIRLNGSHDLIENNQLDHIGYSAIRFTGDYAVIRNNFINYFTLLKDDGAGIYTSSTSTTPSVGRVISNNIVLNGIGAKEGTTASTVEQSSGIYIDDDASGVTITGNTAANCGKTGLYIHNAFSLNITGNTFFNNTGQSYLVHDSSTKATLTNVIFTNNVCISKVAAQKVAYIMTRDNDISTFGTIDHNYYARPLDDNLTIDGATGLYTTSQVTTHYSLATWQPKYGKDIYSHKSPITFSSTTNPDDVLLFEYNATTASKTVALNSSYVDVKGNKYSTSLTLEPFTSVVLMKDSSSISTASIPVISSASTASGTVGVSFNYQITASFSPTSYGATGLPAGFSVNTTTGLIAGTPTASGSYIISLTAKNTYGTATKTLTLTVNPAPQPPVISSGSAASGMVNSTFNYQITGSNSPTSFGATGLPAGLTIDTSTGLIGGKPTTAGTYAVSLSAANTSGTGTATMTLTVNPMPAPVISSAMTTSGMVGSAFTYQIAASNSPTSFGATGLPEGLSINTTTGLISGKPTTVGTYTVSLSATNATGTGSAAMTLTVSPMPAPVISSSNTATANVGTSFTYQIAASGSPTAFGASGLPAGLLVNGSTGLISGTPTITGVFAVSLSATNATGTGTLSLTITVNAAVLAPVISSASSASCSQNNAFSYQITASNTPTSYGATGLPSGLSINTATGLISGTPSTRGNFNVTLTAKNSGGTGTKVLSLTINKPGRMK